MSEIVQRTAQDVSYLACDGKGMPIVLLHGIGSNAQSFVPLMRALAGRHPTLAWDAPGYGDSHPLSTPAPDSSDYAAALQRLLTRIGLTRCVLLGQSLGTLIAARFALTFPASVAHLFLVSPALGHGVAKGDPLPAGVAARIEDLDRLGPERFAVARAPNLMADAAARPDVLRAVERAMAAVRRPGYDQAARLLAGGTLLQDAARLEVSTAVLVGDKDRVTPPANCRRVFDALRGASHAYREIPAAGHAVCQEEPMAVAAAIVDILGARVEADG
jgi:pimeloyl-ACP methyl ester carboxylesterase